MGCCFRGFQFCWPHVMRFLHPRHGTTTSEGLNRARFTLDPDGPYQRVALAR
jgi:hypothetical protein